MIVGVNTAELLMFILGAAVGVPIAAVLIVLYWFRR